MPLTASRSLVSRISQDLSGVAKPITNTRVDPCERRKARGGGGGTAPLRGLSTPMTPPTTPRSLGREISTPMTPR